MRVYLDQTLKWLKRGIDFAFDITDVVFSVFLGGLSYYVLTIGLLDLNKEQSAAAAGAVFSGARHTLISNLAQIVMRRQFHGASFNFGVPFYGQYRQNVIKFFHH